MDTGPKNGTVFAENTARYLNVNITAGEVSIKISGSAAAIVATEEEISLFVDDKYIIDGDGPVHIAKLNLAMIFIDALSKHPDWFARGLKLISGISDLKV